LHTSDSGKYRSNWEIQIPEDKTAWNENQAFAVEKTEQAEFLASFEASVALLVEDPERALSALFDLTAARLVRFSMTITKNQMDAEDALQGAFTRIASRPKLLVRANTPWPYLIRTVRNESLRILNKRRVGGLGSIDVRSAQEPAVTELIQVETAERVRQVLEALPASQYEVVILKHWEELTFAEIAEVLGKSQNTVASRYRYAMEKLQRNLESLVQN
jgi:RNA polymerase sigma-70 factor, ECF subfamily